MNGTLSYLIFGMCTAIVILLGAIFMISVDTNAKVENMQNAISNINKSLPME